jgi:HD-like signal output (HDOD) protein
MDSKLKSILKTFANISEHAAKAKDILNESQVDVDRLSSVIELDVALSSKILQIANSPFFGLSRKILSVKDAIVVIGLHSANNTISMAAVTNKLNQGLTQAPLDSDQLWLRALIVACACKVFAKRFKVEPQKAFMLGMFHLIGRMALNNCIAEYAQVVELQKVKGCSMEKAELEQLKFAQKHLGIELVKKWHLPEIVELAISDASNSEETKPYSDLLCLAKFIGQEMSVGENYSYELLALNVDTLDQFQISQEDLNASFSEIDAMKTESMELIN